MTTPSMPSTYVISLTGTATFNGTYSTSLSLFENLEKLAENAEEKQNLQSLPPHTTSNNSDNIPSKVALESLASTRQSQINLDGGNASLRQDAKDTMETKTDKLTMKRNFSIYNLQQSNTNAPSVPESPTKKTKRQGDLVLQRSDSSKEDASIFSAYSNIAEVGSVPLAGYSSESHSRTLIYNPPATPTKKNAARTPPQSPHEQLFSEVSTKKRLTIREVPVNVELFAKGSFMNAYSITANAPLIPNMPNDQVLLKLYHGERTGFGDKLPIYMKESLKNYETVQQLKIPVATIYNSKTALTDRFFIVQKIPYEVDLNQPNHIEQVTTLFKKSFQSQVLIDLAFGNLRVQENGLVTLVDFVEKPFEFTDTKKMQIFAIQFLKSWCNPSQKQTKEAAQDLLKTLTQDIVSHGFSLSWNQAALDECFIDIKISSEKV